MTSISDIASIVNGNSTTTDSSNSNELGQEDFLKLMTVQLQNQDPFKPMEDGQFIAQMAQFSTASGIGELQESFSEFASSINGNQILEYSNLIDREVMVNSDVGYFDGSDDLTASINVPTSLSGLSVKVYTESGALIDSAELGPQSAGQVEFEWDGTDSNGAEMPAGKYRVTAETLYGGETHALSASVMAKVESVSLGVGGRPPNLNLVGIGQVSTTAISQIK